jgi:hypothetical protein
MHILYVYSVVYSALSLYSQYMHNVFFLCFLKYNIINRKKKDGKKNLHSFGDEKKKKTSKLLNQGFLK